MSLTLHWLVSICFSHTVTQAFGITWKQLKQHIGETVSLISGFQTFQTLLSTCKSEWRKLTINHADDVVVFLRLVSQTHLHVQHLTVGAVEWGETSLWHVHHRHVTTLSSSDSHLTVCTSRVAETEDREELWHSEPGSISDWNYHRYHSSQFQEHYFLESGNIKSEMKVWTSLDLICRKWSKIYFISFLLHFLFRADLEPDREKHFFILQKTKMVRYVLKIAPMCLNPHCSVRRSLIPNWISTGQNSPPPLLTCSYLTTRSKKTRCGNLQGRNFLHFSFYIWKREIRLQESCGCHR